MVLLVTSCKKDLIPKPNAENALFSGTLKSASCDDNITLFCDVIPHYTDFAHFKKVYECLEESYESFDDDWEATYNALSDDEYNHLCDSVGFDEDRPLLLFEQSVGYASYRIVLRNHRSNWLSTQNWADCHLHFDFANYLFLNSMTNNQGNVAIGNSIYHTSANGTTYRIDTLDCSLLNNVMSNPAGQLSNPKVFVLIDPRFWLSELFHPDSCSAWRREIGFQKFNSNNNQILWVTAFKKDFLKSHSESQIFHFKKKNGNWRPFRTKLRVNVHADYYSNACDYVDYDAKTRGYKRRMMLQSAIRQWNIQRKIRKDESGGIFEVEGPSFTHYVTISC